MPKNIASAAVNPQPATPISHRPIFKGLPLLGPAMADKTFMPDKKAALPGLPPPDEDDVLEFESRAVPEAPAPRREVEDRHQAHTTADDDEKDEETIWEDSLYSSDRDEDDDDDLNLVLHPQPNPSHQTPNWLNDDQSPVRALDMSEQNYEDQAAAAATAPAQAPQQGPSNSSADNGEGLEDTFHIDLD